MSDTRKRPWLAVLLAVAVSGLGHAYLRRWGRALAWYAAITATLVFVVPDAAVERLASGDPPPAADVAPALLVVVGSVVDAYVLAVRHNRSVTPDASSESTASSMLDAAAVTSTDGKTSGDAEAARDDDAPPMTECPHCGREVDAELDFCHWCTEELPGRGDAAE